MTNLIRHFLALTIGLIASGNTAFGQKTLSPTLTALFPKDSTRITGEAGPSALGFHAYLVGFVPGKHGCGAGSPELGKLTIELTIFDDSEGGRYTAKTFEKGAADAVKDDYEQLKRGPSGDPLTVSRFEPFHGGGAYYFTYETNNPSFGTHPQHGEGGGPPCTNPKSLHTSFRCRVGLSRRYVEIEGNDCAFTADEAKALMTEIMEKLSNIKF